MPDATRRRRNALEALCDTYVPPVEPPAGARGLHPEFWARRASDIGVHHALADYIDTQVPDEDRDGLHQLLDLLAVTGFTRLPAGLRAKELGLLRKLHPDIRRGLDALRSLTILHFYGMGVEGGSANPNWALAGYPGPPAVTPPSVDRLEPLRPPVGAEPWELEADVVVVGSGSGGGVVAAELAQAGRDVVVVEAGEYLDVDDFPTDELEGWRRMYWRGAPTPSDDGNITVLAGAALGGGSTINWMVCTRPRDDIRAEWAAEHGLTDVAGKAFDDHLDAVAERISVNPDCSPLSSPNERLREGADALGWSWFCADRNADRERFDEKASGFIGFGDRTGARQGTLATYLRDATNAGARLLVNTRVDRVLVEGGRAAGVAATYQPAGGTPVAVTIRARDVVVAAGALETPAVLLRSGIGGPAAGRYLRVHPVTNVFGFYDEPQESWLNPPLTIIVDEFADRGDGRGFILETPHVYIGLGAAVLPWWSGRDHKLLAARIDRTGVTLALPRELGSGSVTLDDDGEAVISYPLDDAGDRDLLWEGFAAQVRAQAAAGARAIVDVAQQRSFWRRGESVDGFLEQARGIPLGTSQGRTVATAHQMGSARMGKDPVLSVAGPDGQLHDTPGVWIADTSAFPTSLGTHPMLTCMALARRTAHALLASSA